MATYDSTPVSLTAAADLSAKYLRFGKYSSTGVTYCSSAGERADGVIGSKPTAAGDGMDLFVDRIMMVELGDTVTAGDSLTTDNVGRAVTATATQYINGIAIDGGAVGAYVRMLRPLSAAASTGGVQSLAAPGAVTPTADYVLLSVDGTDAFTLAAGVAGHRITIECIAAASTPVGTLTLADAYGTEGLTYVFTGVGQILDLVYTSTGWKFVSGVGIETRTSGALEPAWSTSFLSVTGTVGFTLADGVRLGQRKVIECTVAATTPLGTLTIADAYTGEATAIVFTDVGQKIVIEWTAAGWKLLDAFGAETVTAAGALEPVWPTSYLSISGTIAYTLAAGTRLGQRKTVKCSAAAATPLGTVTLADAWSTEPTAWVFTAIGQAIEIEWTATGWRLIEVVQSGSEVVAASGTAKPLCLIHQVDVNAADFIQPAAVFPGQRSIWQATAATGAASTISGVFYDEDGSADGIDANMNAIGDLAAFEWTGTRWLGISLVSVDITT